MVVSQKITIFLTTNQITVDAPVAFPVNKWKKQQAFTLSKYSVCLPVAALIKEFCAETFLTLLSSGSPKSRISAELKSRQKYSKIKKKKKNLRHV